MVGDSQVRTNKHDSLSDARGEQVECRVVGGVSCVDADGCFDFYCVDWCAHPING